MVMMINQSRNHMFNHNKFDSDMFMMNQSQVMANNGGGYATWQPVVNNSAYRINNNNNKNWKMNRRNVSNKAKNANLNHENRLKPRRFAKKKYSKSLAPLAPRNTTSFLMRAKKSGGIASLVSPCAVTPAVLPTPVFSPSSEDLGDMAKEEWGVDGYGSMKGLIRVRNGSDEDEGVNGLGVIDDVEGRLDHDLSRFEMVYASSSSLENRVDDRDSHIAILEEEHNVLKERLFFMERELGDLRSRLQSLEVEKQNGSENDCGSKDNDNSDGNKINKNDEDECSVYNDDHKIKDEDDVMVGAKDRKLNGMVVNVGCSDISIDCGSKTNDNNDGNQCSRNKMDNNNEDEGSVNKIGKDDNEIIESIVVDVDSSEVSIEPKNH